MIALKTLLAGLGCAAVFGSLAASGVPTRMNPPPEPHWAQMPEARPIDYPDGALAVASAPRDLVPLHFDGTVRRRNGVIELPPGASIGTLRRLEAAQHRAEITPEISYVEPQYEPLGLADIRREPVEPLPHAGPALSLPAEAAASAVTEVRAALAAAP